MKTVTIDVLKNKTYTHQEIKRAVYMEVFSAPKGLTLIIENAHLLQRSALNYLAELVYSGYPDLVVHIKSGTGQTEENHYMVELPEYSE